MNRSFIDKLGLLSMGVALLTSAGCNQEAPPPPAPPPPPPPAAPPPEPTYTGAALAKVAEDCHTQAVAAHDLDKVQTCWTSDATLNIPGMPPASGALARKAVLSGFFAAAPDFKPTNGLTLINGNRLAGVRTINGTQTGPLMGAPPSGKKFGLLVLAMDELTPTGKIRGATHYFDAPTMMAQLGLAKQPARSVLDSPGEHKIVAASGSKTEADNVALLKAGHDAFSAKDMKKLLAFFSDDSIISDQGMPADAKGRKEIEKLFKMFMGGFPDAKLTDDAIWGAGDYVASQITMTGTNTGDMKAMKLKKTGKPVKLSFAEIAEVKDGKVKQLWWFGNGAEMAMQLGLMPPPGGAPQVAAAKK